MEIRFGACIWIGLIALGGAAEIACAQERPPDAGAVLRGVDPAQRPPVPDSNTVRPPSPNSEPARAEGPRVRINAVEVVGSTHYDNSEWQKLFADVVGRDASYADLRRAADRVTQRYRADGWFARAYLPEQSLDSGALKIAVIEAKVGAVRIEGPATGGPRVQESIIRDMLTQRQRGNEAVAIDELERAAMLLNEMPGIRASVVLAPGANAGETDIVARIDNTRRFVSTLSADNRGIESTGRARVNGELLLESPLRRGDELAGLFDFSEGIAFGRLSYALPIGSDGWRIEPALSLLDYTLGDRFASLEAHGRAFTWGLSATYPWIRSNRLNARLAFGYEERDYENFALGGEVSKPQVRAFQASLLFDRIDTRGGGGLNQLSLRLTRGDLDLSRNTTDLALDAATAHSDGKYTTLGWTLARLQRLADRDQLLIKLTGQLASRNLGSSEKMSLGGATGVRAYPELEASGDKGWVATAEWFHSFARQWRFSLFYDYGQIEQHDDTWLDWNGGNPGQRNSYSLQGTGMSLGWTPTANVELHAAVATRTSRNPARDPDTGADGDGSRHEPQLWVTSRWRF